MFMGLMWCGVVYWSLLSWQDAAAVLIHGVWCGSVSGHTGAALPGAQLARRDHLSRRTEGVCLAPTLYVIFTASPTLVWSWVLYSNIMYMHCVSGK